MITIHQISDKRGLNDFIDYPFRLYHNDKYWVPPLRISEKTRIDTHKHPYYKNSEIKFYLAKNSNNIVGRIASIYDKRSGKGYFGYLHAEEDSEVFETLLKQVEKDLGKLNVNEIIGPVSPSINYEMGVLTQGFERPPYLMMPYNKDYYDYNIQQAGFTKAKDFYAYNAHKSEIKIPDKIIRVMERVTTKFNLKLRNPDMNNFLVEIEKIEGIYNDAMANHWGFVPMVSDEFRQLATDLKNIIDPNMVIIAEIENEPVGFIMCLPDYNEIFKRIKNGRLFPTGILKLLFQRRSINGLRVVTLGVKRKYQPKGIGSVLYFQAIKNMMKSRYNHVEFSWIMEDNFKVRKIAELIGTKICKTYRLYSRLV